VDVDDSNWPWPMESDPLPGTVWKAGINATFFQPVMNEIENALETRRRQAADDACSGRETAVSPNQMLAP